VIERLCLSLISLILAITLWLSPSLALPAQAQSIAAPAPEMSGQLVEKLEKIKAKMQKLRFCYNESCFYRNVESKITPPANANGNYTAVISAIIDRPSTVLDSADYTFTFSDHHWQLVKGEEYTDVAEYAFNADRYEIFSVHSSRSIKGKLAQARTEGNLKSGYLPLYYDILREGIER